MFCIFCGYQYQDELLKKCPKCGKDIFYEEKGTNDPFPRKMKIISGSDEILRKIPQNSPTRDNIGTEDSHVSKTEKTKKNRIKPIAFSVISLALIVGAIVLGITKFDMGSKLSNIVNGDKEKVADDTKGLFDIKLGASDNGFNMVEKLDKDYNSGQYIFTNENKLYCFQTLGASFSEISAKEEIVEKKGSQCSGLGYPVAVRNTIFFLTQVEDYGGNVSAYNADTGEITKLESITFECMFISGDGEYLYAFGKDKVKGYQVIKVNPESLETTEIQIPEQVLADYTGSFTVFDNKMYYVYSLEYSDETGIPDRGIKSYDFKKETIQYEEKFGKATDFFKNKEGFCYLDHSNKTVYFLPHDGSQAVKITSMDISRIAMDERYIYGVNDETSKVYRIKTDGTQLQEIPIPEGIEVGNVVSGEWICVLENNQTTAYHIEENTITKAVHNVFEIMGEPATFEEIEIPLIDLE